MWAAAASPMSSSPPLPLPCRSAGQHCTTPPPSISNTAAKATTAPTAPTPPPSSPPHTVPARSRASTPTATTTSTSWRSAATPIWPSAPLWPTPSTPCSTRPTARTSRTSPRAYSPTTGRWCAVATPIRSPRPNTASRLWPSTPALTTTTPSSSVLCPPATLWATNGSTPISPLPTTTISISTSVPLPTPPTPTRLSRWLPSATDRPTSCRSSTSSSAVAVPTSTAWPSAPAALRAAAG